MSKAIKILLFVYLASWALFTVVSLIYSIQYFDTINNHESESAGEAIGFIFAAIFLALFGVLSYGVTIISALILIAGIIFTIIYFKAKTRKTLLVLGILSIIFGYLIPGILMLVQRSKIPEDAESVQQQ